VRCPFDAARYGYYVESVHGYEDEPNGVIKIDPVSQAKGSGLQVTTRLNPHHDLLGFGSTPDYHPIQFGPTKRYGSADVINQNVISNPAIDEADYVFPGKSQGYTLRVAVYRTGGPLDAGNYTTGLTVYLVYR